MNNFTIQATLHSGIELRQEQDGTAQASCYCIFPSTRPEGQDNIVRLVAYGEAAEQFRKDFARHQPVVIEGRMRVDVRNKPDGTKVRELVLVARRVHGERQPVDQVALAIAKSPSVSTAASGQSAGRMAPAQERASRAQGESSGGSGADQACYGRTRG